MRMVTRILPLAALALGLGAAQLPAQQPGNTTFQWYIGGQGGIMDFGTVIQGRSQAPVGGVHLLVTAKRTGLLITAEQMFGSNEQAAYTSAIMDTSGLVSVNSVPANFDYLRKYTATLVAFPIKGPLTPFFGIGVGFMHAGGYDTPDEVAAKFLGSSGFGTLIGGLNFKVSRFSAFGQYQITTGPATQFDSYNFVDNGNTYTVVNSGNVFTGPTHTLTAGLRFGLGNARERPSGGGY
jgi:hypothetical protein